MTDEPEITPLQLAEGDRPEDVMAECRDRGARRWNEAKGKEEFFVILPNRRDASWMQSNVLVLCLTTTRI